MPHTPTPWRVGEEYAVIGADDRPVFTPNRTSKGNRPSKESLANRQLIVRSVNSHAALVAALDGTVKAWLRDANDGDGIREEDAPILEAARAALALARKEPT